MTADLTLHGQTVTLREFRLGDVDDVLALIGDDRVTEWLSFDSRDRQQADQMLTDVEQRRRAEPRAEFYLAITASGSENVVGFVRLAFDGVRAGKLGYAVAFNHWGKGYATDAAGTLVDYAFRELGLHRISAAIAPENVASLRMAQRLGMTFEGRIRDHVHTNGRWRDSLLYSVLADEWAADAGRRSAA